MSMAPTAATGPRPFAASRALAWLHQRWPALLLVALLAAVGPRRPWPRRSRRRPHRR